MSRSEKSMMLKFYAGLFLALTVFLLLVVAIYGNAATPVTYDEYVVQQGDSLWSIATMSDGYNSMDIQNIIEDIQQRSKCNSNIYPGQIVYIPIYGG